MKIIYQDFLLFLIFRKKDMAVPKTDIFYDGKCFIPKMSTENGEVDNQTLFISSK